MNKKLLLLSAFLAGASWTVLAQDLVLSEGQYYTDETQTTPYRSEEHTSELQSHA